MTSAIVAAVLSEIAAYERGERQSPLTWPVLEEFAGFSTVALWRKEPIKAAFRVAKEKLRQNVRPIKKPTKSIDERLLAMQKVIDDQRETINRYDEMWSLYEANMHRMGLDPEDLRQPLEPTGREVVRKRTGRKPRHRFLQ